MFGCSSRRLRHLQECQSIAGTAVLHDHGGANHTVIRGKPQRAVPDAEERQLLAFAHLYRQPERASAREIERVNPEKQ